MFLLPEKYLTNSYLLWKLHISCLRIPRVPSVVNLPILRIQNESEDNIQQKKNKYSFALLLDSLGPSISIHNKLKCYTVYVSTIVGRIDTIFLESCVQDE